MQITKLLNDKEIKHGLLLVEKYPKPINKNNVVNTNSALLQFYSGNDGAGRKFYQYMNPERLQAILFMIVNNTSEKDDVKANAATMFKKTLQKLSGVYLVCCGRRCFSCGFFVTTPHLAL
jgi:predicted transcriptional regulator